MNGAFADGAQDAMRGDAGIRSEPLADGVLRVGPATLLDVVPLDPDEVSRRRRSAVSELVLGVRGDLPEVHGFRLTGQPVDLGELVVGEVGVVGRLQVLVELLDRRDADERGRDAPGTQHP